MPNQNEDPQVRAELERNYAVLAEVERRRSEAPCLFYQRYKKHPKQLEFHDAGKTHRRRLFTGGNRSGKTTAGVYEALAHAYGYNLWAVPGLALGPDGDLPQRDSVDPKFWIRNRGLPIPVPNRGIIVTGLPRARGLGDNIWPTFHKNLPQAVRVKGQITNGNQGIPDSFTFPNGSRVVFTSAYGDDIAYEGFEVDWCWVDEPIRRQVYSGLWRALTVSNGAIWFTLTPISAAFAWMSDWFSHPPADMSVTQVSIHENPYLTKAQITEFLEGGEFNENERAAREFGRPEILGGLALPNFRPDVHCITPFRIPEDWQIILSADVHHLRPAYFLWLAFNSHTNTYYAFREWPSEPGYHRLRSGGKTPQEYAALIRNIEGRRPADFRLVDPRFGPAEHQRHGYRETSWVEQMREFGLEFDPQIPNTGSIDFGLQRIQHLFHYDSEFPVSPDNSPRLFLFEGLHNLTDSLLHFGFRDMDDPIKGLHKKLSEEYKDAVDALRYAILWPVPLTDRQVDDLQVYKPDDLKEDYYDAV